MGSSFRGVLFVVAMAGCAISASRTAQATPTSTVLRVACPQKVFSVAFYPKGSASDSRPHVKVAAKGETLGLVFPKRLSFGPACKAVHDTKTAWDGGPAKTTSSRTTLRCSLSAKLELRGGPFVGSNGTYAGNRLLATLGHTSKVFLSATMKAAGSSLRYDTHYCKKG